MQSWMSSEILTTDVAKLEILSTKCEIHQGIPGGTNSKHEGSNVQNEARGWAGIGRERVLKWGSWMSGEEK